MMGLTATRRLTVPAAAIVGRLRDGLGGPGSPWSRRRGAGGFRPRAAALFLLAALLVAGRGGAARAAGAGDEGEVHTPLAGRPLKTRLFGREVDIPARDRGDTLALTLGAAFYAPPIGDERWLPVGALYYRRDCERAHLRAVLSGLVNEVDAAWSFGLFEVLGRFENYTIPFPSTEIVDGKAVDATSIEWGQLAGYAGVGVRLPVAPFEVDSDLRIQLFYYGGYLYTRRVADTDPFARLPPDTYIHGFRLRVRYDALERNLMELPHRGIACGLDCDVNRRDRWADASFGLAEFKAEDTRDYVRVAGYFIGAAGIPWLSERHRFILFAHAGFAPERDVDRFSAFRVGGGPFPSETDDLYRPPYPGALFNQVPISDYAIATLEYRLEVLFFLYLHLRGTIAFGKRPTFRAERIELSSDRGETFSAGVTSGLPWDSTIYLEYAYDTTALRSGTPGSSFLLLWSKAF